MMGRPPKPTALKLLAGNPGKRALNDAEPRFPVEHLPPPTWLTASGKREWRRLLPTLCQQGLFTVGDVAEFSGYCLAWSEVGELTRFLRKHGRTVETASGYLMPRPEVAMRERALARVHLFGASFGLSPSARTRIKASPEKVVDPFETYLTTGENGHTRQN
jgi:P27 family predicted phage terminase small subunit